MSKSKYELLREWKAGEAASTPEELLNTPEGQKRLDSIAGGNDEAYVAVVKHPTNLSRPPSRFALVAWTGNYPENEAPSIKEIFDLDWDKDLLTDVDYEPINHFASPGTETFKFCVRENGKWAFREGDVS